MPLIFAAPNILAPVIPKAEFTSNPEDPPTAALAAFPISTAVEEPSAAA